MLEIQDLTVNFSYKKVLTNVSTRFESGKIYLILGENGAGKTTLAKVLCGDLKPTSGKIFLDGKEVSFSAPREAFEKGIGCVHQRPLLAESVSITENIILGNKHVDYKRLNALVKEFIPNRKLLDLAKNLTPYERVAVAMIGVLLKNPKVLILDEPSALLTTEEREFLAKKIREYVDGGNTAIIVSHFVQDALKQADAVVVLKDGNIQLADDVKNVTLEQVVALLFASSGKSDFDVSWPKDLPVEFLEEPIDQRHFSRITADGKKAGLIPSDRTFIGSNPNLTILQLLTALQTHLPQKQLIAYANDLLKKANVNIRLEEKAARLSGGMLQRLILQREIAENPDVLYLCDPLQGLDMNAVDNLFNVLRDLSKKGTKIIVQEAK